MSTKKKVVNKSSSAASHHTNVASTPMSAVRANNNSAHHTPASASRVITEAPSPRTTKSIWNETPIATHATAPKPADDDASNDAPLSSHGPLTAASSTITGQLMNPFGPSVGSFHPSSLYWCNLLLLGFDPLTLSAKLHIELSPTMFDTPNARALQILLHFILLKLKTCPATEKHNNTVEWKEITAVFHHSYPCLDRTQQRDFMSCCVGALLGFERGPAAVFPAGTIRKSHFAAPQGEKLYHILWHLTSYTLQMIHELLYSNYQIPILQLQPITEPGLYPHLIKCLKVHIMRQSIQYVTRLKYQEAQEERWRQTATQLVQQYQAIQTECHKLDAIAAGHTSGGGSHHHTAPRIPGQLNSVVEADRVLMSTAANAERMFKLASIREAWLKLEQLLAATKHQRGKEENIDE